MVEVLYLGPVLTIIVLAILVYIAIKGGKSIVSLAINSVIGLVILVVINFLPFIQIPINIWTILITALGGIPGIALLILLNLLGIVI
ncbi:MAG: pro-sigmaK processing inhibitor BofA family protein [Candidatus Diapherotrites archaeon]|uniref:Pro-sigmaK processing inhibitor BofA family protein n=1 Tax=Candidatus Iainarchaeum sp. TaxID=3101447 RepID=A0A8T4L5L5_9ARCH|nr:pro-sigmaK processing inhibitor BofA family protein [Candidatus Diapherotrites archaeon]